MRGLPQGIVFSRQDLLAEGWSDSAIHCAVGTGRLARVRRGMFTLSGDAKDPNAVAIAASRSCSTSAISHRSAALIHGIDLVGGEPDRPDLTVHPSKTGDTQMALLHRAKLSRDDVLAADGYLLTSIARTVIDLGRLSPEAGLVAADHCLRDGRVTLAQLRATANRARGWPGIRGARLALDLADPRSESPLESRSRYRLWRVGITEPDLQTSLFEQTRFLGRADFYWDHAGVVGEADGAMKYTDASVLIEEKRRQESLEEAGLIVVRWDWNDLKRPAALAERIERAFRRGIRRDSISARRGWQARRLDPLLPDTVGWAELAAREAGEKRPRSRRFSP